MLHVKMGEIIPSPATIVELSSDSVGHCGSRQVFSEYTQYNHSRYVRVIWMLEPDGHEKMRIFGGCD